MESSFIYYINNTNSVEVELFKQHFKTVLDSFPEKPCSYRIIYNICEKVIINQTDFSRNIDKQNSLNKVWMNYFKLKLNGTYDCVFLKPTETNVNEPTHTNKKKIEFNQENPIR